MYKEHLEDLKKNKWLVDIITYNCKGSNNNIPVTQYEVIKNTVKLISFVDKKEIIYLYPAKNSVIVMKPITKEQILEVEKIIEDINKQKLKS